MDIIQNTTNFIRAYDHNGNERIVTVHVEGSGSQKLLKGIQVVSTAI